MSQRAHFSKTIPLCHNHHQWGGYGIALHAGQKFWETVYGSETELLKQINTLIGDEEND